MRNNDVHLPGCSGWFWKDICASPQHNACTQWATPRSRAPLTFPLGISATEEASKCCIFRLMSSGTEDLNVRGKFQPVVDDADTLHSVPVVPGPPPGLGQEPETSEQQSLWLQPPRGPLRNTAPRRSTSWYSQHRRQVSLRNFSFPPSQGNI